VSKQDKYRENAAECQRRAKRAWSDKDRRTWFEMAESWLRMLKPP